MSEPQLASDRFQIALQKVKLVAEYLNMCEYHQDGEVGSLYSVILLLREVENDLDSVVCFVPDVPMAIAFRTSEVAHA